ncbi:MAG: hypothetical protein E7516_07725 [Ruminococcaceae bacterium]|nr:hypothetical protein [Oscillospiraceae bacterium]
MKFAKKITALILTLLMLSVYLPFTFAFEEKATDDCTAESNTEFAIKTAEIIKNEDNADEMLRIIGKFSVIPPDNAFSLANECVISDDGRFVLQFSDEKDLLSCLDRLNNNPRIIYAERDMPVYTGTVEESAEYLSWGVEAVEADVYSQSVTPSSVDCVTVAIIDSGCEDIDFIKDKLVSGYDFFENDNDAFQDVSVDSHGTFLASIITDCVGSLPVEIMPVRVLASETGSLINAVNGIIYAVDNGADVINISLGAVLNNCSSLEYAVNYAEENGVTVVVCAGNTKSDMKNFCPAHNENAITVSSVNEELTFSESFSNFGDGIDLTAPGENIVGYNALGELIAMSGTSMSAAYVSAAAAMFILDNPGCSTEQTVSVLTSNAQDLGEDGKDIYYGYGMLKLKDLITPRLKIKNNTGEKTIRYGETLRLTAEVTNNINDFAVWWYVDGVKSGEGKTFEVSPESGSVEVAAKLVDADGTVINDVLGNEIADFQTVSVKSGFFQRLISFFKNLFRINRTVIQKIYFLKG